MADIASDRADLRAALDAKVAKARRSGRSNYYLAYTLKLVGLLASIVAGALGIVLQAQPTVVGLVALVPGAAALIGQEMKFQQKAHHFYRMACELESIASRAAHSDVPADSTAALAAEADRVRQAMNREWEQTLGFGWSGALPPATVPPR